jgi:hypothetical protein
MENKGKILSDMENKGKILSDMENKGKILSDMENKENILNEMKNSTQTRKQPLNCDGLCTCCMETYDLANFTVGGRRKIQGCKLQNDRLSSTFKNVIVKMRTYSSHNFIEEIPAYFLTDPQVELYFNTYFYCCNNDRKLTVILFLSTFFKTKFP